MGGREARAALRMAVGCPLPWLTLARPSPGSCSTTVVGNQMLRGISGGQKKRVTSGEALVGHAKALYADEVRRRRERVADYS